MKCKYCGSENVVKNGKIREKQSYLCKNCGYRFYLDGKFVRMKTDKNIIVSALNLYYDGLSLRKAQRNLEQVFGERVSQVTILNWLKKYSKLVKEFTSTLTPELSGYWHEDETMIQCEGRNIWFWEMIDEETRFLVASHISGTRTLEDTIAMFKKGYEQSKKRPKTIFVDGSFVYQPAFNKVFYSRYKAERVELIQKVGIRSRETNNLVERLHGTIKDRTKPMRGLKDQESTKAVFEGYTVHYNFVRPHQSLDGKTPAQVAGIENLSNWRSLIEQATQYEAQLYEKATQDIKKDEAKALEVIAK